MDFFKHVNDYCETNGIEVVKSDNNRVLCYGIECNGFFDNQMPVEMTASYIMKDNIQAPSSDMLSGKTKLVLAYSIGNKNEEEVLSLLAHEFGHANQFIENSPLWIHGNEFQLWEQYFEGTDVTMEQMYPAWSKIVALEADCETRVVDFIDEFKLNIKKGSYIQRANAYLYFYHFSLMNRKWYVKAPYEIHEIVQAMPKEMMPLDFYTDLNNQEIKGKKELFDLCF